MKFAQSLGILASLVIAGCNSDRLESPSVLSYSATSHVVNTSATFTIPSIETVVTIRNETSRTLSFHAGGCHASGIKVFGSAGRNGAPVWSTFDTPIECALVGYAPLPLEPGQSREVVLSAAVRDVLSGGKPEGTYFISAVIEMAGGDLERDTVEIPAGSVSLSK